MPVMDSASERITRSTRRGSSFFTDTTPDASILRLRPSGFSETGSGESMRRLCVAFIVTVGSLSLHAQTVPPDADPRVEAMVTAISETRLKMLVDTLAGFHTRNTLSD